MIPSSASRRKKITLAIVFTIALLAALLLLTNCPGTKKAGHEKRASTTTAAPSNTLDSTLLIQHLAFLTAPAMEGRETGTPGNKLAETYIEEKFDSLRLLKFSGSYLQPFTFSANAIKGNNVIAYIKGTRYPDSYIILSAHYDHLGIRNGEVYTGADDNASGTAALLTMAEYFTRHPPRHSIIFAAFDAEEKGLAGSGYFAEHSPVPLNKIILNVNMDMISRNDKHEIYACGTYHYPFLKPYIDSIQKVSAVTVLMGHDNQDNGSLQNWTNQSDHYPFHKKNIPFIYFGVEDHPDYHQPGDTFDKIDKHFYYQASNMITAAVLLLDKQETLQ